MSRLILASSSPRRIQLLRESNFEPLVVSPEIDELSCDFFTPSELALFNANRKAAAVAIRHPEKVVLAADTIVALGPEVFGKPRDFDDARRMLKELVGRTHVVITGVALIQPSERKAVLQAQQTSVKFRSLAEAEIDRYLETICPLDKAGAYAAQDSPDLIIERVDGSFTNVIGLPMELVVPLLKAAGIYPGRS
jgi:nucleoside triphosphate pyrophosphatase